MDREPNRGYMELRCFIDQSPTAHHAVAVSREILLAGGFKALSEEESWTLEDGGKYYIERNGSALAAFIVGTGGPEEGFLLTGAHTDSPCLKLKDRGRGPGKNGGKVSGGVKAYSRLPVEVYGGPILSTWLDRELSIAGVMQVRDVSTGKFNRELIDLKRPVAVIPNPSIHFNRTVNQGFEYNPQVHLQALAGRGGGGLTSLLSSELGVDVDRMGPHDLFLYNPQPASLSGFRNELIVSGRIDNLAGCHAALAALVKTGTRKTPPRKTIAAILFDNEEIGSRTLQGAESGFLKTLLNRITLVRGGTAEEQFRALAASLLISVDGAQAVHPNFPEYHDPDFAPVLNGGPALKLNANYKYATTSEGAAFFDELCRRAGVPEQRFVMRSDLPCGSTIGPVTSSLTGIRTIDVGIPMVAMHSIRETAGILDQEYMIRVLETFYSDTIPV